MPCAKKLGPLIFEAAAGGWRQLRAARAFVHNHHGPFFVLVLSTEER